MPLVYYNQARSLGYDLAARSAPCTFCGNPGPESRVSSASRWFRTVSLFRGYLFSPGCFACNRSVQVLPGGVRSPAKVRSPVPSSPLQCTNKGTNHLPGWRTGYGTRPGCPITRVRLRAGFSFNLAQRKGRFFIICIRMRRTQFSLSAPSCFLFQPWRSPQAPFWEPMGL
jgi:hypothetical protein